MSYIDQLKADTAESNRLRKEEVPAKRTFTDPRLTEGWKPLTEQIIQLWVNLPLDLRSRPILISELIPQLRGRYNAHPSAGDAGQALRSLNFTPVRDWRSGRRRWLPGDEVK